MLEVIVKLTQMAMWIFLIIGVGMLLEVVWSYARLLLPERMAKREKEPPAKPSPWKVEVVECHPAWVWTCDRCGRDSFVRSFVPELSSEELHEAAVKLGIIDDWQSVDDLPRGLFYTRPVHVTCKYCGMLYSTVDR